MSQEMRLRLAARQRLVAVVRDEDELPGPLRVRRFSEGLERPGQLRDLHVARFSEGVERLPDEAPSKAHVGSFADGMARGPQEIHVGRFSEGVDHSDV
jgi:hypothetical protein